MLNKARKIVRQQMRVAAYKYVRHTVVRQDTLGEETTESIQENMNAQVVVESPLSENDEEEAKQKFEKILGEK